MGPSPNQPPLKFGPYSLDLQAGELRKSGSRVRLQEKPLQLLAALAEQSKQVVTREELHRRLWPEDTFVDFETGLNTAVSKLRDALSDDAQNPRYIETIPRRGYRFLAPVERIETKTQNPTQTDSPAAAPSEPRGDTVRIPPPNAEPAGRSWRFAQIFAFALVVCLGIAYGAWRFYEHEHVIAAAEAPIRSIAVLPFDNFSGDATQDYFADGLTDELITDLAQLGSLRVTSRSSVMQYKGAHAPMEQIRRELHVDAVVEGSVIRSGDSIRVNAQLIETSDDRHLWAQTFSHTEEDVAALQDDVAQAVAERVEVALDPSLRARLANAPPVKAEAYEAFLHGIYYLQHHSDADLLKGLDSFKQAAALDPTFAAAYAGMAQTYCLLGDYDVLPDRVAWPQAEMNAQRALAMDNSLSRAHAALALALWRYDWNWKAADAEFQKALALSPNDADTHHFYGLFLATKRGFRAGRAAIEGRGRSRSFILHHSHECGLAQLLPTRFPDGHRGLRECLADRSRICPRAGQAVDRVRVRGENRSSGDGTRQHVSPLQSQRAGTGSPRARPGGAPRIALPGRGVELRQFRLSIGVRKSQIFRARRPN